MRKEKKKRELIRHEIERNERKKRTKLPLLSPSRRRQLRRSIRMCRGVVVAIRICRRRRRRWWWWLLDRDVGWRGG